MEQQKFNKIYRYKLDLTLLEDAHTGTGTGGANGIDSLQILDRYGNATIRKTHYQGLLLESAEELKRYQPGLDIEQLFGSPKKRKRRAMVMTSFRLDTTHTLGERLLWTSSARKFMDRVPLQDSLHTVEYIPAGTKFVCDIELLDEECRPLLERCVRHTNCLGGKRNRGSGLIQSKLTLKETVELDKPVKSNIQNKQVHLRLLLRNIEPLNIPTNGTADNNIASECYIRGQLLYSALADWVITHRNQVSLLFQRNISVGDALPLPLLRKDNSFVLPDGTSVSEANLKNCSVLPIPLSIHASKRPLLNQKNPDYPWWFGQSELSFSKIGQRQETNILQNDEGDDVKRPDDREFVFHEKSQKPWYRYSPVMGIHMRNQSPDYRSKNQAQLFSEEEIAEDTYFIADIYFPDAKAADAFTKEVWPVLEGKSWLTIGRGGRPVEVAKYWWIGDAVSDDTQKKSTNDESRDINEFIFTLESDLIAYTPTQNFYNALSVNLLLELTELSDIDQIDDKFKDSKNCNDAVEVRGFNSASGLPRAPLVAIRRGSSIRVKGDKASVTKLYQRLSEYLHKHRFLGERIWEGFGRFRMNLTFDESPDESSILMTSNSEIGHRETILEEAHQFSENLPKGPSKSQWQFLRQQALIASSTEKIIDEINKILGDLTKASRKNWEKVEKDLKELKAHLKKLGNKEDAVIFLDALIRWHLLSLKQQSQ